MTSREIMLWCLLSKKKIKTGVLKLGQGSGNEFVKAVNLVSFDNAHI